MASIASSAALWLPIFLSAVTVFLLSSLIHMFSPWHKNDYKAIPDQDRVMDALRPFGTPAGDYLVPRPASRADMTSAEYKGKVAKGPNLIVTVLPNGPRGMSNALIGWFIYSLIVSWLAGLSAMAAVGPGAEDHRVFHFAMFTAFIGYSVALWQM